jgi:hypothetical protein
MRWALLEMPPFAQPPQNFTTFDGTRRFITVFTRALRWSLCWTRTIRCISPYPISLKSILILSFHLYLSLTSGHFTCGFPTRILHTFVLYSCVLHALPISPPWLEYSVISLHRVCVCVCVYVCMWTRKESYAILFQEFSFLYAVFSKKNCALQSTKMTRVESERPKTLD